MKYIILQQFLHGSVRYKWIINFELLKIHFILEEQYHEVLQLKSIYSSNLDRFLHEDGICPHSITLSEEYSNIHTFVNKLNFSASDKFNELIKNINFLHFDFNA